ncbi:hypothetical protein N7508_011235 (mitochondrion) [Penicillium antarcticum]|nr:hypothetical protein N7508_011235 [Penicillium antarcticum]
MASMQRRLGPNAMFDSS